MQVGGILKICREKAGFSQEQLAEKLHRSRSCISKIESDKKTLDLGTFIRWMNETSATDIACAIVSGVDPVMLMQQMMPLVGGFIKFL
ncbi:helix-turn-helix domain-containing protein [Cytobacillus gottheilii]|uniref:Helix-turn-helix transcriptional regulator n=1 Tax=Cytobacillus gottheilii TaxID=859144 RepID=A0ABX8FBP3_9BACI|nr:helix-turn-helix transcriptional regulator [Cytobacillus gottheilii]QVY60967.1 helix-turn-helix transcriptional regulator [Cytobacillus gottheilii]